MLGTKGDYGNTGVEVGLLALVILMGERFLRQVNWKHRDNISAAAAAKSLQSCPTGGMCELLPARWPGQSDIHGSSSQKAIHPCGLENADR